MLQAEFDRLGIDPEKVTAKAPQKIENAVFDIKAELVDPDGTGGADPTGITLTWTERLIADYNQDGMVTGSDLTPIGQNYCFDMSTPQVTYEDPENLGGIDYWPTGDADDGGDGAHNWRLARIDGNNDGYILQYDITPIAVHWEERLTGYRVWRKPPGGGFQLVPNPDDTGSPVTLTRPESTGAVAPVRYSFTDNEATASGLGEGAYAYYVQPWDAPTSTSGPVSPVAVIDNTGSSNPLRPVARLYVTPDFGGAPVVVTLDGSYSSDGDGTVEAWHWDFDADGITDWVSTEEVPEESSAGVVDTITPVSDGVVTVTYRQGSADWYYPEVVVVDNDAQASLPAFAQLGVSGWEHEMVGNDEGLASIQFDISAVGRQPGTGIEFAAGQIRVLEDPDTPWTTGKERGVYFAWCESPGNWTHEQVANYDTPAMSELFERRPNIKMVISHVFWDENNQPGILIRSKPLLATDGHVFVSQRRTDGNWETVEVYQGELPVNLSHRGVTEIHTEDIEQGKFIAIMLDIIEGGTSGSTRHYYALWYDNGEFSVEDIGIELHSQSASTGDRYVFDVAVDNQGTPYCLIQDWGQLLPNELRILKRESAGNWVEERWDNGDLEPAGGMFMYGGCVFDATNRLQVSVYVTDSSTEVPVNECRWYSCSPGNVTLEQMVQVANPLLDNGMELLVDIEGISVYVEDANGYYHCRLESSIAIKEELWTIKEMSTVTRNISYRSLSGGIAYSSMSLEKIYGSDYPYEYSHYFSRRVDPRY